MKVQEGYGFDEVVSTLVVIGSRVSDRGVYRCTVTNHDNKSNYREKSIYVHGEFQLLL